MGLIMYDESQAYGAPQEALHYAHMSKPEVMLMNSLQGGERRNEHGYHDLTEAAETFEIPEVMQLLSHFYTQNRQNHAHGGSIRDAGRFGDDEIVIIPHHLREKFKMAAGGESINPTTGYPEYYTFQDTLNQVIPSITAGQPAPSPLSAGGQRNQPFIPGQQTYGASQTQPMMQHQMNDQGGTNGSQIATMGQMASSSMNAYPQRQANYSSGFNNQMQPSGQMQPSEQVRQSFNSPFGAYQQPYNQPQQQSYGAQQPYSAQPYTQPTQQQNISHEFMGQMAQQPHSSAAPQETPQASNYPPVRQMQPMSTPGEKEARQAESDRLWKQMQGQMKLMSDQGPAGFALGMQPSEGAIENYMRG